MKTKASWGSLKAHSLGRSHVVTVHHFSYHCWDNRDFSQMSARCEEELSSRREGIFLPLLSRLGHIGALNQLDVLLSRIASRL
ncbi:MAG: hypothetical protein EOO38_16475 [Cytophagaceae bacterium]|nr:MAG: hypothetical protein EOO38_16475 [Cytophagaceae bacterium]